MTSPFPLPMIYAAWGFRNGGAAYNTAGQLADLCVQAGVKTVAVQLGWDELRPDVNWTTLDDIDALKEKGLHVILWGVANATDVRAELARLHISDADWHPQIEGPGQRDMVYAQDAAGIDTPSIVTTYSGGGDGSGEAAALRGCGVKAVHVECYPEIAPWFADIDRMLGQGVSYGWHEDELYACIATYRNEYPSAYTGLDERNPNFSIYIAENTSRDQWTAWGDYIRSAVAPPEPTPIPEEEMEPVTDQQALASHKTISQAAIQNYTDPKPRGRNTVCWRIANADDATWNASRDAVVRALDDAGVPQVPA